MTPNTRLAPLFASILWACAGPPVDPTPRQTTSSASTPTPVDKASSATGWAQIFVEHDGRQAGVATFGLLLPRGATDALLRANIGPRFLPTQVDAKAFHEDGSIRHAVVTIEFPRDAPRRAEVTFGHAPTRGEAAVPLSIDEANIDATVEIVDSTGTSYNASVQQLLSERIDRTWLSGPLVSEWHTSGALRDADGVVHPHLTVAFYLRAYRQPGHFVVDVVLENTRAFGVAPRNLSYDLTITVADKVVALERDITHYRHARWRKTFRPAGHEQPFIAHDLAGLEAAGAVPRYDPQIEISPRALTRTYERWAEGSSRNGRPANATMGSGLIHAGMPDGGDRPDIGPLPRWTVEYLLTMQPRSFAAMVGTANQAGSFPIHYRDAETGMPLSIEDHPQTSIGIPDHGPHPLPECEVDCDVPYGPDTAHMPSLSFIPYLVTGDFYHLEELLFWSSYITLFNGPAYRLGDKGLVRLQQVRGQAWSLRTLAHAAWITPHDHPQHGLWNRILRNNLRYYLQRYVGIDGEPPVAPNPLGIITEGTSWPPSRWHFAWLDDVFTWAASYVVGLGYEEFRPMWEFKSTSVLERMVNPDYCWIFAALARQYFRPAVSSPTYSDYGEVYRASVDEALRTLPCGGHEMARALNLEPGEMLRWRREEPRGFPIYMQIALAAAVDSGDPRGAAAWQRWLGRTNPHDPSRSPEWSIVPRPSSLR